MVVNAIEGVVENGKIRLREDVPLPENATVYVIVVDQGQPVVPRVRTPRLAHPEQARDFHKQVLELAPHASV